MMPRSRQRSQRDPRVGRPRRGDARLRHAPAGLTRAHTDGGQLAHPSPDKGPWLWSCTASAFRCDRNPRRWRPQGPASSHPSTGRRTPACSRGRAPEATGGAAERFTRHLADRADVGGKIRGNKGALLAVPLQARSGLIQQAGVGNAMAAHYHQVAAIPGVARLEAFDALTSRGPSPQIPAPRWRRLEPPPRASPRPRHRPSDSAQ